MTLCHPCIILILRLKSVRTKRAIESTCCGARGQGAKGQWPSLSLYLFPLVRKATHATRFSPPGFVARWFVSSCGERRPGGREGKSVIRASREAIGGRAIRHPIIVRPLTATLPNVARVAPPQATSPHTARNVCVFPSPEGHWQFAILPNHIGCRFRGRVDHRVWSLPRSCHRHRWPKTKEGQALEASSARREPHTHLGAPSLVLVLLAWRSRVLRRSKLCQRPRYAILGFYAARHISGSTPQRAVLASFTTPGRAAQARRRGGKGQDVVGWGGAREDRNREMPCRKPGWWICHVGDRGGTVNDNVASATPSSVCLLAPFAVGSGMESGP